MFAPAPPLSLEPLQRERLMQLATSGKTPQKIALRARIILMAAEGVPNNAIANQLGTSRPTVLHWRERFLSMGVPGIERDAKRPGRKKSIDADQTKRIVEATLHTKPRAATHWSTRTMARAQ